MYGSPLQGFLGREHTEVCSSSVDILGRCRLPKVTQAGSSPWRHRGEFKCQPLGLSYSVSSLCYTTHTGGNAAAHYTHSVTFRSKLRGPCRRWLHTGLTSSSLWIFLSRHKCSVVCITVEQDFGPCSKVEVNWEKGGCWEARSGKSALIPVAKIISLPNLCQPWINRATTFRTNISHSAFNLVLPKQRMGCFNNNCHS